MTNQEGPSSQLPNTDEPINFSMEVPTGSPQFIAEPEVKEDEERIRKSKVIIPCPNSPHANLGLIPDDKDNNEELSAIFPCFEKCPPLIFTKGPYNLSFMQSKFRAEPKYENNGKYICWLNKVEGKKGRFWKDIGIFDHIQLSRQGPRYHKEMLIVAFHFWNSSTSSLHLKCGMLTPTLLDVATITGLKPIGQTFDLDGYDSEISFDFTRFDYDIFIKTIMLLQVLKSQMKSMLPSEPIGCLCTSFVRDPYKYPKGTRP